MALHHTGEALAPTHRSDVDQLAGLGADQLRLVPTDDGHRIDPAALAALMDEDRAAGRHPFLVTATIGTTSSHAIDPVAAIGEVTRRHGAWLHVDGAHAGAAAVVPELRFVNDGLELADRLLGEPRRLPIVIMSGVYEGVAIPGVHFLRKPFRPDELTATVSRALADVANP